ncbi:thiol-disulfide oxidoreductase DCC family protein [Haloferacaceae archaeon DSL9]
MTADSDPRPRIVYDDDCGFCAWCVSYATRRGDFDVVGFSEVSADERARLPDDYRQCVHLLVDDRRYSCGAATEEILARLDAPVAAAARGFRRIPASERVRDPLYRWVADHRNWFGKLVR